VADERSLPSIATARLVLRALRLGDAPEVRRLAGDPAVADGTRFPHPYPAGAAETWIVVKQPASQRAGR